MLADLAITYFLGVIFITIGGALVYLFEVTGVNKFLNKFLKF